MGWGYDGTWRPDPTFGAGSEMGNGMPTGPLGTRFKGMPGMGSMATRTPLSLTTQSTSSSSFPWMTLGSGAVTAGGLLGSLITSNKAGKDAMSMSKRMFDLYSDPNSSYYRTAQRRMNQLFTNATPTLDTITGSARMSGLGTQTSAFLSNQIFNQQSQKNRQASAGAVQDLFLQGQGNAMNALSMYNQAAAEANASQGSFWDNITGVGIQGLLGLLV